MMKRTRSLTVALATLVGTPAGALLAQDAAPAKETPAPAARPADAASDVAREVERGVVAYNAQDLKYYETVLGPDVVYVADDGATFVGKERVLALFRRIFTGTPAPTLAVADVVTGGKGDVAWARFKWTRTKGADSRPGVASAIFVRGEGRWTVVLIQNTPLGHAMGAAKH